MGENRETNWKREGKRETSKETFIGESWQTVYSLQLISHHGRYRTHALTRTYILAFTTIKRTKHNNKKKEIPRSVSCALWRRIESVPYRRATRWSVTERNCSKYVTISNSYWISYDSLLITNSPGSSSHWNTRSHTLHLLACCLIREQLI